MPANGGRPDPTGPGTGIGGRLGVKLFSTSPQSKDVPNGEYLARVADVARWSEEVGCEGILVYTDNGLVDPWLVSQHILQSTRCLCPLVALQPVYMHPYSAAKMVASLAYLHRRRVYLNLVAGGFRNDLLALGDETPHDERYDRAVAYATILRALLAGDEPVTHEDPYYRVANLRMKPAVPAALRPGLMVSGSSPAGLAAARALGAITIKYPKPPLEEGSVHEAGLEVGCRLGIVAREDAEEAWRTAHERFPDDRRGQLVHGLAMQVSDSRWHAQLSERSPDDAHEGPYWLGPFKNAKTFCPYLVGSYAEVGRVLARYVIQGFGTFVLDIPPSREELEHTRLAFEEAASARTA